MKKFDLVAAPNKDVLICYFINDFYPLIKAQLNKEGYNLDN